MGCFLFLKSNEQSNCFLLVLSHRFTCHLCTNVISTVSFVLYCCHLLQAFILYSRCQIYGRQINWAQYSCVFKRLCLSIPLIILLMCLIPFNSIQTARSWELGIEWQPQHFSKLFEHNPLLFGERGTIMPLFWWS